VSQPSQSNERETLLADDVASSAGSAPGYRVEDAAVLAILDVAHQVERQGANLAARVELTTQQWLVLLQIEGDPNFPRNNGNPGGPALASEIAAARGWSRALVSMVISELVKKGLVAQGDDPDDRRRKRLALTPKAKRKLEQIEPLRRRANDILFDGVPAETRAQLVEMMLSLRHRVTHMAAELKR